MTLTAKDLGKTYGNRLALDGVDLEVRAGQIVSLLGANGSGKSTLLRLAAGLLRPTAGTVRIAGLDPVGQRQAAMAIVGFVPDQPLFWEHLSGRRCLQFVGSLRGFSRAETDRRAAPLVDRFELAPFLDGAPHTYSEGTRKKLAIVMGLLHDPEVILLDETASGLDPLMVDRLDDLLRDARSRQRTVLLSTHLLDQAERLSDLVAVLTEGRLLHLDRADSVMSPLAGSTRDHYLALLRNKRPAGS